MKIFTTGGCGFIGSNFVIKQILQENNTILNFDSLTYAGNKDNLEKLKDFNDQYTFIHADICDFSTLYNSIKDFNPDVVIHFAAESHVDRSITDPLSFARTNVMGTLNLLQVAKEYWKNNYLDKLFYHISTDEVYGALGDDGLFTETSKYDPHSPYSASKASSDHFVRSYKDTYGLPVVISNCSNNFGPNQFTEKLIPLVIQNVIKNKPIPVYGNGKNIRDWIYIDDHVRAIDLIFHKGKIGETYNIGGSNEYKNIDLIYEIIKLTDSMLDRPKGFSLKLINYVTDRPGHDFRYAIDCSKLKNQLGWKPSENFNENLKKTVLWYLKYFG